MIGYYGDAVSAIGHGLDQILEGDNVKTSILDALGRGDEPTYGPDFFLGPDWSKSHLEADGFSDLAEAGYPNIKECCGGVR